MSHLSIQLILIFLFKSLRPKSTQGRNKIRPWVYPSEFLFTFGTYVTKALQWQATLFTLPSNLELAEKSGIDKHCGFYVRSSFYGEENDIAMTIGLSSPSTHTLFNLWEHNFNWIEGSPRTLRDSDKVSVKACYCLKGASTITIYCLVYKVIWT